MSRRYSNRISKRDWWPVWFFIMAGLAEVERTKEGLGFVKEKSEASGATRSREKVVDGGSIRACLVANLPERVTVQKDAWSIVYRSSQVVRDVVSPALRRKVSE
jgi:hypothetical protein